VCDFYINFSEPSFRGRPIALHPEKSNLACAALVVQALYFVPQVRQAVASIRLPDTDEFLYPGDPGQLHSKREALELDCVFSSSDVEPDRTLHKHGPRTACSHSGR